MSASKASSDINKLLAPHLFQVVGSSPEGLRDKLVETSIPTDVQLASQFVGACLLAASTVKQATEGFLTKVDTAAARNLITQTISIGGKANFSALTLIGHCLMTSEFVDSIEYVKAFRTKMGQRHIWDGDFTKGRASDAQVKIWKEKKNVCSEKVATMFGNGFFKWANLYQAAFTAEEAEFWRVSASQQTQASTSASQPEPESVATPMKFSPRYDASIQEAKAQKEPEARGASISSEFPAAEYNYVKTALRWDDKHLKGFVEKEGLESALANVRALMKRDPTGEKTKAASRVGK